MDRAIGIIKREIETRESQLMNPEYLLSIQILKIEIKSLNKVLELVKSNSVLGDVSNCHHPMKNCFKNPDGTYFCTKCESIV